MVIELDMNDEVLGAGMPCGGSARIYVEPMLPKPMLWILGHGRIAETVCGIAALVGFDVVVNDPTADHVHYADASRLLVNDLDYSQPSVTPEGVLQFVEPPSGRFVAAIDDQALGVQQYRRSQIAIVVPPPAWAAAGATEAQDAFPTAIQPCPLNDRLRPFAVGRRRRVSLQPWLDDVVLSEQMTPICHQILDHRLVPALWRSMFWSRSQQRGSRSHAPLARGHVLVLSLASVAWRATLGPFALLCPRNQA